MSDTPRLRVDRPWDLYPVGTKAHAVTGGHWIRVEDGGWKWYTGATSPTPGGDACGACIELPEGVKLPVNWVGQTFYRFEDDTVLSALDDHSLWCEDLGCRVVITCKFGRVREVTRCGAHVEFGWRNSRWISATTRRRYAYPDVGQAWESFKLRKMHQAGHLRRQLARVTTARELIDRTNPYTLVNPALLFP